MVTSNLRPENVHSTSGGDTGLVARALKGEPQARMDLERRLQCVPKFLGMRNQRAGNPLDRETLDEVGQDIQVLIWSKIKTFEGRAKLETWVYRICVFEFMNALRRKQVQKDRTAGAEANASLDEMPALAIVETETDRFEGLRLAMAELPGLEGEILSLKFVDGLTFQEIGPRLGLSTSGAKYQYYQAVEHLRQLMRSRGETK